MAYTFLSLVNDILNRVNEVPLNNSSLLTATGFNADVKNAVNLAINEINTKEFSWPFNHVDQTLSLTIDQVRYPLPVLAKVVSWDSFRIRGNSDGNYRTQKLMTIDYESYLEKYSDMEYRASEYHSLPTNVFRDRTGQFGVIAPPDRNYTLDYEYYQLPNFLENPTDVPTIPEAYKYVIHNGAMFYAYMFRGDNEAASISRDIFDKHIEVMRIILINRHEYVRSTVIRG